MRRWLCQGMKNDGHYDRLENRYHAAAPLIHETYQAKKKGCDLYTTKYCSVNIYTFQIYCYSFVKFQSSYSLL